MNIFFDTSSLIKLYHFENGTFELEELFSKNEITNIYISELSHIEFISAIFKKLRTKELSQKIVDEIISLFEIDIQNYQLIPIDNLIISNSKKMLLKYGLKGLRSLDSIQLSTAYTIKENVDLFITSDKLLETVFRSENLNTSLE